MRKLIIVVVVSLVAGWLIRAQTGSIQYFAPSSGTTVANCGTPAGGFPLCGVATGWYIWNGTTWVQLGVTSGASFVSSISVNGGTPQTGPVALTIPSKASSTTTTTIQ